MRTCVNPIVVTQMSNASHPGDRLRAERERLGLSQEELGAIGGVRKQAQHLYEKGTRKPDADYLQKIASAGVDVAFVVLGQPVALTDALANVRVASEGAKAMAGVNETGVEYQLPIFESLQAQRAQRRDENQLVADYRRCTPPDKKTIRQMAARLAGDAPAEAPNSRTKKRAKERR